MEIDLSKYGFRKDFDFETRFDLKTEVEFEGSEYIVSTVDLGLDHSFGGGVPLYYETMICTEGLHYFYNNQWRYETEQQARKHHEKIVEAFSKGEVKLVDEYFEFDFEA